MEFVYVVKRSDLFDLHFPQGFLPLAGSDEVARYLDRARRRGFFVERRHAEEDSSLKQIIPYTLVTREQEILLLRRSKRGGDARLHDKLSIGVGGHINPPDHAGDDLIQDGALREIAEELDVESALSPRPVGIINDDSNPVGSVHFGVVCVANAGDGAIRVRETELLAAEFIPIEELRRMAGDGEVNLESWSRLIGADIDEALGPAR